MAWLPVSVGTLLLYSLMGQRHLVLLLPLSVLGGVTVDHAVGDLARLVPGLSSAQSRAWQRSVVLPPAVTVMASTSIICVQNLQRDESVSRAEVWPREAARDAVAYLQQATTPEGHLIGDDEAMMVPFGAGRVVVPLLNNPTPGRLRIGHPPPKSVIAVAEQHRPQAIVLGSRRRLASLPFREWVKARYALARDRGEGCQIHVLGEGTDDFPAKVPPPCEPCLGAPADQAFGPAHPIEARRGAVSSW